jgi:hypothetical protein
VDVWPTMMTMMMMRRVIKRRGIFHAFARQRTEEQGLELSMMMPTSGFALAQHEEH